MKYIKMSYIIIMLNSKRYFVIGLIVSICLISPSNLLARELQGINFDQTVQVEGKVLRLRGTGVLKWLFYDIYIVALYMPHEISSERVLDKIPKQLQFYYLRSMQAKQFKESGDILLSKNATVKEIISISSELDLINSFYKNVRKNDVYTLSYIPEKGTRLALNGTLLGTIPGDTFASIYYRIWLGDKPVNQKLKSHLLNY